MAAITQIRQRHSDSRAYYDRKIAEGKATKRSFGSLGRQISDAVYGRLRADARHSAQGQGKGPGGNRERLCRQAGRLSPRSCLWSRAWPAATT